MQRAKQLAVLIDLSSHVEALILLAGITCLLPVPLCARAIWTLLSACVLLKSGWPEKPAAKHIRTSKRVGI